MIIQLFLIHVHGGTFLPSIYCNLANVVLIFFKVDNMPPIAKGVMLTLVAWACLPIPLTLGLLHRHLGSVMTHGYGYDGWVSVEEPEVKSMDMMGNHMKEMDMDTMEEWCI
jgi:hypothetical protein